MKAHIATSRISQYWTLLTITVPREVNDAIVSKYGTVTPKVYEGKAIVTKGKCKGMKSRINSDGTASYKIKLRYIKPFLASESDIVFSGNSIVIALPIDLYSAVYPTPQEKGQNLKARRSKEDKDADERAIEYFIKKNGVTKCPPAYAAPVTGA